MEGYIVVALSAFVIITFIRFIIEPPRKNDIVDIIDIIGEGIIILMVCSIWPVTLLIICVYGFSIFVRALFDKT